MSYFDDVAPKRPRYFRYIAITLVSAIIGGTVALAGAKVLVVPQKQTAATAGSQVTATSTGQVQTSFPTQGTESSFQSINIAKTVGPAIVGIGNFQVSNGYGSSGLREAGSGSGIIVDASKGYIVTNNHVIDGASKIVVSFADGRTVDGKLVGTDTRTDLAVVQIADPKDLVAASIGDSNSLQVGEPVMAIGNPGGQQFARSVTVGVVSALNRVLQLTGESSFNLIQTDAAINPGNSGGALLNWQGKVVGINSAKNGQTGFEGMGFAIPISDAWPIISQLMQTGRASHAGLLVSVDSRYTAEYAQAKGGKPGAMVASVSPNGPAATAGVKQGDIIGAVNDKAINDYYDLTHELFKYKAGDTVKLTVIRDGKETTLQAVLAELPTNQ